MALVLSKLVNALLAMDTEGGFSQTAEAGAQDFVNAYVGWAADADATWGQITTAQAAAGPLLAALLPVFEGGQAGTMDAAGTASAMAAATDAFWIPAVFAGTWPGVVVGVTGGPALQAALLDIATSHGGGSRDGACKSLADAFTAHAQTVLVLFTTNTGPLGPFPVA
jgi:hypothetical protein